MSPLVTQDATFYILNQYLQDLLPPYPPPLPSPAFRRMMMVPMHIVHVYVHVKPECLEQFKQATVENARNSIREPGIARFDVIQQSDDPTRFVLVECYRDANAPAAHKETPHYKTWAEAVAGMLAEPRSRNLFSNVFPADAGW